MKKYIFHHVLIAAFLCNASIISAHLSPTPAERAHNIICATQRKDVTSAIAKERQVGCSFCLRDIASPGFSAEVVKEYQNWYIKLNKFPLKTGHILIIAREHVASLARLSASARTELIEVMTKATIALDAIIPSVGFGIVINMGEATGASMPDHLHVQIIPRNINDISTFELINNVTNVSMTMEELHKKLLAELNKLEVTSTPAATENPTEQTSTSAEQAISTPTETPAQTAPACPS